MAPPAGAADRLDLFRVGSLLQPRQRVHALAAELFGEVAERFHAALGRALPNLAPDETTDRFGFVVGAMVHEVAGAGPPGVAGLPAADQAARQRLARMVHIAAAGLRAPAAEEALP